MTAVIRLLLPDVAANPSNPPVNASLAIAVDGKHPVAELATVRMEAATEHARLLDDLIEINRRIRVLGSRLHAWDMGGGTPRELEALLTRRIKVEEEARRTGAMGAAWTSPSAGMEFVWIEALKLWVGKYEVTNGEYRKKERWHNSRDYHGRSLNGERQPVVHVCFRNAKAYAAWLTERDHAEGILPPEYRYRLPSENEWITYAQCGDGRTYPWGSDWPPRSGQAGNYHGREGATLWRKIPEYNDGFPVTAPVDRLWANPWSLHGVGGNVWEACASDATGESFGAWRGAGWGDARQDDLRCTHRGDFGAAHRDNDSGFRLVMDGGSPHELNVQLVRMTEEMEEARRREAARRAEAAQREKAEAARREEAARRAREQARREEAARQAQAARQEEAARQAEAARQEEVARQAQAARQEEAARQAQAAHREEAARQAQAAHREEEARQAQAALRAWEARYFGQNWTSSSTGMEFVWIKALNLWVGKFEVTNGEYRKKEPGHDSKTAYLGLTLDGDRQPVVYVNFGDAKAYAAWLTQRDHAAGTLPFRYRYRLPSEDEWMTYAQCGDGREYPWGHQWPPPDGRSGNYSDRIRGYNSGFAVSAPVDLLWANPWGLHGVGGNVWEACASDVSGNAFGAWRGASWDRYGQAHLRCSFRIGQTGSLRDMDYGFRLVLSR